MNLKLYILRIIGVWFMKLKKRYLYFAGLVFVILILIISGVRLMSEKDTVVFHTNKGDITIRLYDDTKITTDNFKKLVEDGFYDGTKFHRVIKNFMIQGGDPLTKDDSKSGSWGTGGPGYKIKDDFRPDNQNIKGTISMANSGPNTGGSQFFINLANNNYLDEAHPVFGKVTQGMDVVKNIGGVQTNPGDVPTEPIIIESAELK
ncbi:peptidylprolyl isomerase [Candidatus Woesearchaeota archaeon]|nr:peptidylprolyl isomerase [Candidatus Woesearchaeota archaeon]